MPTVQAPALESPDWLAGTFVRNVPKVYNQMTLETLDVDELKHWFSFRKLPCVFKTTYSPLTGLPEPMDYVARKALAIRVALKHLNLGYCPGACRSPDCHNGMALKNEHIMARKFPDIYRQMYFRAVALNGNALRHASPSLQADRELVHTAVVQNGNALHFAHIDLRRDPEILRAATAQNASALQICPSNVKHLPFYRELCLDIVAKDASNMCYRILGRKMFNDREFNIAAVKRNYKALEKVPPMFRCDMRVIIAAVDTDVEAMHYIKTTQEVPLCLLRAFVKRDGNALYLARKSKAMTKTLHQASQDEFMDLVDIATVIDSRTGKRSCSLRALDLRLTTAKLCNLNNWSGRGPVDGLADDLVKMICTFIDTNLVANMACRERRRQISSGKRKRRRLQ